MVLTPVSGSAVSIVPEPWSLKIGNNLVRQGDSKTGDDGNMYCLTGQLHEGRLQIELEATLYLEDDVRLQEMLANTAITSLSTVIGGKTITLNSGHHKVDGNAWPELKQDVMNHTLRMQFTSVTVA